MIELGQCYIKFDIDPSEYFKEALEKYLLYKGKIYSKEFYNENLVLDDFYFKVKLEEGSLKSKLIIYGSLVTMALSQYSDLRSGIDYIISDSKNVSENIVKDISNEPTIDPNTIIRVEKRIGTPGRIKRLLNNIDKLRTARKNLTEAEQEELIEKISSQYQALVFELDEPILKVIDIQINQQNFPITKQLPYPMQGYPFKNNLPSIEEVPGLINENEIKPMRFLPNPKK